MIKAVAFDNDCVISKGDMLEFVSCKIGKGEDGALREKEYHELLASAKTAEERDAAARRGLAGKYSVVRGVPLLRLKEICAEIEATRGAKECLDALRSDGAKIFVVSATLLPLAEGFFRSHGFWADEFITSTCGTAHGILGDADFVLTPTQKGERLKATLEKYGIRHGECAAVGDSTSELPMFEIVGKERSIGFNCRESLLPHVGHVAYLHGDEKRNLMKVCEIIRTL